MSTSGIDSEIRNHLIQQEQILFTASQSRIVPGGSLSTPNAIYITNMRVIFKDPRLLGLKASIVDVNYKDISNIRLSRGVFSTELFLKSRFHTEEIKLPAVNKEVAQEINALIQKGIRGEMPGQRRDDDRTKNTTVLLTQTKGDEADPLERLEKLVNLKEKGILTDEEFQQVKSRLVRKLTEEDIRSNNTEEQIPVVSQQEDSSDNINRIEEQTGLGQDSDLIQYENSDLGIKLNYPANWKRNQKQYYQFYPDYKGFIPVVAFYPQSQYNSVLVLNDLYKLQEGIILYVRDLTSEKDNFFQSYIETQVRFVTRKLILLESDPTTIAGNPGWKLVYSDNRGFNTTEISTVRNNTLYIIRFDARTENSTAYLSIVQKIVESFVITR